MLQEESELSRDVFSIIFFIDAWYKQVSSSIECYDRKRIWKR